MIDTAGRIDKFKTKHARNHHLNLDQWPEHLLIRFRGNPDPFLGKAKHLCSQLSQPELRNMVRLLMFLSFLNEPLYIGKTTDIYGRFLAHHSRDFLYKMKRDHMRSPDEFLFFVIFCDTQLVRPIESILIQLVNPPYCRQGT